MSFRFERGVIHTFPLEKDEDQEPYIFDVSFSSTGMISVSACGPGQLIKIYDSSTLSCATQLSGHTGYVYEARFFREDPNLLYSASSDSTVRIWDGRQASGPVHSFTGGGRPFQSADVDHSGRLLAAGIGRNIRIWDLRAGRTLRTISDAHTEDITQARFHPSLPGLPLVLATGSTDGLVCIINAEAAAAGSGGAVGDALVSVLLAGDPVSKLAFADGAIACTTASEGLQVWSLPASDNLASCQDLRPTLAVTPPPPLLPALAPAAPPCDYLVSAAQAPGEGGGGGAFVVLAGSRDGALGVWEICGGGGGSGGGGGGVAARPLGAALAVSSTRGGHIATVRAAAWHFRGAGGGAAAGALLCTGGEDCRLALWRWHDDAAEAVAAEASAAAVPPAPAGEVGPGKVRGRQQRHGWAPY